VKANRRRQAARRIVLEDGVEEPRSQVAAVTLGVLAALLVVAGGVGFGLTRPPEWTAETQLLIAPELQASADTTSAYYETLTRGQVTATAAEILGQRRYTAAVAQRLGLGSPDDVTTQVTVVPGTALVQVAVSAERPRVAERFADGLPRLAVPEVNDLLNPYVLTPVGSAAGTAERSGLSLPQFAGAIVVVSIIVGVAVHQLVWLLPSSRRRSALRRRP